LAKIQNEILTAASAHLAWSIDQTYKADPKNISDSFDKNKDMEAILRAKLNQHEDVYQNLLDTGTLTIKKIHPQDTYWGTSPEHGGQNMLGVLWMELRDELLS